MLGRMESFYIDPMQARGTKFDFAPLPRLWARQLESLRGDPSMQLPECQLSPFGCGSKMGTPKWNPGKWKHGLKSAVPWLLNFDPYPFHLIFLWVSHPTGVPTVAHGSHSHQLPALGQSQDPDPSGRMCSSGPHIVKELVSHTLQDMERCRYRFSFGSFSWFTMLCQRDGSIRFIAVPRHV